VLPVVVGEVRSLAPNCKVPSMSHIDVPFTKRSYSPGGVPFSTQSNETDSLAARMPCARKLGVRERIFLSSMQ
jgi:hypothetical protein